MSDIKRTLSCPKCGSDMEIGFLLDNAPYANVPSIWVEGLPERSYWRLTKIKGKVKRKVDVYRCVACGFLESYAVDLFTGWYKK